MEQSLLDKFPSLDAIIPRAQRMVTREKLSYVLDIPEETVQLMVDARLILPVKNADGDIIPGMFDLIKTMQKLLKEKEEARDGVPMKTITGRMDIAKVQKLQSQAELGIINNEMMKGTIVRIEDVDAEVIDMLLALKSKLLGFPSHIARLILGKEDFDEVCQIMTDEMEKTMIDLAPPSPDAIRARNRKLQKYTEAMEAGLDVSEIKEI